MKYPLISLLFLSCICGPAYAADSWTLSGDGQYAPTNPEDIIIKWCETNGERTRYASANLNIKGYEPCGKLQTAATCDAGGERIISGDLNRPYDHRDCVKGPRISITRDGESLYSGRTSAPQEPSDAYLDQLDSMLDQENGSNDTRGMSAKEEYKMEREFERIRKQQEQQDPYVLLQKILQPQPRNRNRRRNRRRSRRPDILQNLSKSEKEMIEQFFPLSAMEQLMDTFEKINRP